MSIDVRDEVMSKPVGELVTQMTKFEFRELLAESLRENFDLAVLCKSDRKKDRVKARQLFCLMNCVTGLGQAFLLPLLKEDWQWIHFRSAGDGKVQIEVEGKQPRGS